MKLPISLRQHKIIQLLRDSRTYMTGEEISEKLSVSSRTVRSDIADINRSLSDGGIRIEPVRNKGYILKAEDPSLLRKFAKDHHIFMSRQDRVYYLSVLLCTSEKPLQLPDLEDDIAVSSSTLSGDLAVFKESYVNAPPFIGFSIEKNTVFLEKDEFKRRYILVKLLSSLWDYSSTGNVYYESSVIDSEAFEVINRITARILFRHGIRLADHALICLNLYLSVAYHRIRDGFLIGPHMNTAVISENADAACNRLFHELEKELSFSFPEEEKMIVSLYLEWENIACIAYDPGSRDDFLPDEQASQIAGAYLRMLTETFGITLENAAFKNLLKAFLIRLSDPLKDHPRQDETGRIRQALIPEFEMAALFLLVADQYRIPVCEEDLFSLAYLLSGALRMKFLDDPSLRFHTVLLCHAGVFAMQQLVQKTELYFKGLLNITDVLPVNLKDYYDFSQADLILTTVNKPLPGAPDKPLVQISVFMTEADRCRIDESISRLFIPKLFPAKPLILSSLLQSASAHEKMLFRTGLDLIQFLAEDFIKKGIFTESHLEDLLRREQISSYAAAPGIAVIHSLLPARETAFSVCTLDHRVLWNSNKIRIVIVVALKQEDQNLLFTILDQILHKYYQPDVLKRIKTKAGLIEYYRQCESAQ